MGEGRSGGGWVKWAALVCLVAGGLVRPRPPPVRTRSGLVRGALAGGNSHIVYYGVPYATVDHTNRFQAPLPPPKWDGVLEAVDENIRCPQTMIGSMVVGDPDCLKLNIYTPVRTKPGKRLPVMVYVHGGCFFEGTGAPFLYGGDYFPEHGVIFVGVNYRLNVEGFLCLGIEEAPGNAGLKDQIAALRWIKENIEAFGGDPDNVTLFGESAGAVSTSMLILSPAARGLFHRAILQSGSSLAPWALQHDPTATASALVEQFGYDTKDPHKIYKILASKTISEIINAIKYSPHKNYITAENLFVPCVERDIPGVEAVLTQYPADVIKSGNYSKVPMIIGYNANEGIYFVGKDYGTSLKEVDPLKPLQSDLIFPTEIDKNMTAEMIREFYFSRDEEEKADAMVDLYSDVHFKFPAVIESELFARTNHQPIFYYLFRYSGYLNMPKLISGWGVDSGASHADELFYMFKPHLFPLPPRPFELHMMHRMLTLWTNFAKFSDPTPSSCRAAPVRWRASREHNPAALVIDERLHTARLWDPRAVRLWNDTYTRYRRRAHNYGFTRALPS